MSAQNVLKTLQPISLTVVVACTVIQSAGALIAQDPAAPKGPAASPKPQAKSSTGGAAAPAGPGFASKLFPDGLPKLDQFLKVGLERHPDVIVARSKVEAARAELLKAEAIALNELIGLHQRIEDKRHALMGPRGENVKSDLIAEASALNLMEWEAALTLGLASSSGASRTARSTPEPNSPSGGDAIPHPVFVNIAYPKGPVPERIKENPELELKLVDSTLQDFASIITEKTEIPIVIDKEALEGAGFSIDGGDINFEVNGAALASVLQRLEDRFAPVQLLFVVRDYGLLITTRDSAPNDAVTALDFIRLKDEQTIRSKVQSKLEAEPRESYGSHGGGFF